MNASSTSAKTARSSFISAMVCRVSWLVMANHSRLEVDAGHSARPSRTDPSRSRPSRIEAISPSQQDLGKARQPPAGTKPHLSIFIDKSIQAAGDDTAEAVKTDW